jgi:threonine synthase
LGFHRLQKAGLIDRIPRLVAVQAAALALVCRAFEAGLNRVPPIEAAGRSVAEGLAIAEPVRGRRLLQAIRDTQGMCVVVEDEATLRAQQQLAHRGVYVEPTSATAVARLGVVYRYAEPGQTIAVPLTGSGLKAGHERLPGSAEGELEKKKNAGQSVDLEHDDLWNGDSGDSVVVTSTINDGCAATRFDISSYGDILPNHIRKALMLCETVSFCDFVR